VLVIRTIREFDRSLSAGEVPYDLVLTCIPLLLCYTAASTHTVARLSPGGSQRYCHRDGALLLYLGRRPETRRVHHKDALVGQTDRQLVSIASPSHRQVHRLVSGLLFANVLVNLVLSH
jgi:hypothetical protein